MDKVYLIQTWETGYYKIGYTKGSVAKRLSTLQTGSPYQLEVVTYFESKYAKLIETVLHRRYKHCQVNREWFDLKNEDVLNFNDICKKMEQNFLELEDTNIFFIGKNT